MSTDLTWSPSSVQLVDDEEEALHVSHDRRWSGLFVVVREQDDRVTDDFDAGCSTFDG